MNRKIIHIDCDCFYAAVEMRDDPTLRHRPLAVGGDPGRRGVISTCNYEAREYGVHSAMASAHARRLCPELVILPPRISYYKEVSQQIHRIFRLFTETIEPLSLDEAYLDVTDQPHYQGSATRMAEAIRKQIRAQVGITVSAGVAPNKFLAKIASDWNKPDGLCVIPPHKTDDFIRQLPIEKLHGVGKVTAQKLHNLGIRTCADIRGYDRFGFIDKVGSFGEHLYRLAHGIDERPVQARSLRKSLSVEHTYPDDLPDLASCQEKLPGLKQQLEQRLERKPQRQAIKKAFVKLKFSDFTSTTMECCDDNPTLDTYRGLFDQAFKRKDLAVRLLGVGVRFQEQDTAPHNQIAFEF
ncbi:DNA polymerase IV [Ketobacter sp.]|uniref:DNA polymerase IV n=1 Tax=Ketobacter sp. TaxID=2083498 RepID=UPI000F20AE5B|nr:DNA polymerase IV [Ketobacter sp.]RLU00277.1 MAG: DNA polymerase IV [Ketobacter sp.]